MKRVSNFIDFKFNILGGRFMRCIKMKKILILIVSSFLILTLLNGCKVNRMADKGVIKEETQDIASEVEINKLLEYRDSYVGDSSAVGGIIDNLPGMSTKGFALGTDSPPYSIEVNYGLRENSSISIVEFDKYWSEENTKKIFLNNATTFFILVKNVDIVQFNLYSSNKHTFKVSREELEEFWGKDLKEYAVSTELWETEILKPIFYSNETVEDFFNSKDK